MKIGAWSGLAALNDVKKTIDLCKKYEVQLLDIMVNNGAVFGKKFHLYKTPLEFRKIFDEYKAADIELAVTTWAQPTVDWMEGIKTQLVPLLEDNEIGELTLDIEESWMEFISRISLKGKRDWEEDLIDSLSEYSGTLSITCQVSNTKTIESLLEDLPHQIIVQAYSTANSVKRWPGTAHGKLQNSAFNKFQKWAGPHMAEKRLIMGLAAYDQDSIPGLSEREAVEKCMDSCRINGIDEVRFWRLETITPEIYKGYMSR